MKEQNYLDSLVGVFGHPAAENPGVVIQEAAFRALGLNLWRFLTIDVDPDKLEDAIKGLKAFKMRGINCTIPHKLNVIQYLDELSESAKLIGAVNTIVNTNGHLFGENTDGKGFMESLQENGVDPKGKKIVILGAGGAARAVVASLLESGVPELRIANRTRIRADQIKAEFGARVVVYDWAQIGNMLEGATTVVNSTSMGMEGAQPLRAPLDALSPDALVTDLVYTPLDTLFLREARSRGCRTVDGLGMLLHQAAPGFERWFGVRPEVDDALRAAVLG